MVRPPDQTVAEEAAADPAARKESSEYGRLDEIERARSDVIIAIHKTLAWVVPCALILAFILLGIAFAVWITQYLLPHPWLDDEKRHDLTTILFSGAIGAGLSRGVKAYGLLIGPQNGGARE